jgi:hypothetical protein
MRLTLLSALLVLAACETTNSAMVRAVENAELTSAEANAIVNIFEGKAQLTDAPDPLLAPKSLDDVLEILRRDEIRLFKNGAAFAQSEGSLRGKALAAQIELAWGENQHILTDVLQRAIWHIEESQTLLERKVGRGTATDSEKEKLKQLNSTLADTRDVSRALNRLGDEHLAQGLKLTKEVAGQAPDDYVSYRLLADYERIQENWPAFDKAVAKLAEKNPDSTGLLFARGMEAIHRANDWQKGAGFLRDALKKDPKFARAQAVLVVIQQDTGLAYKEFEALRAISPRHQIVVLLGKAMQADYDAYVWRTEREAARSSRQLDNTPR